MSGPSRRCAVLGDPVAHSLSPVLHRAGYAELGLDWSYDAHRVPAGTLAAFLDGLSASWRGLSLTMPLKREALTLVDTLTERARQAGAVNTVVLADGERHGENTDVIGAAAALGERVSGPLERAVILGGGATATSTGIALCDLGVRHLEVVVRAPARAAQTLHALRGHPRSPQVEVSLLEEERPFSADVLVSTVPAAAQSPALLRRSAAVPVVFEVLYDPWPTPLALAAADRVLVGGLDLLVHQAAAQFELFTTRQAPLAAIRAAGERALAARTGS